jgi:hypothetical protein
VKHRILLLSYPLPSCSFKLCQCGTKTVPKKIAACSRGWPNMLQLRLGKEQQNGTGLFVTAAGRLFQLD